MCMHVITISTVDFLMMTIISRFTLHSESLTLEKANPFFYLIPPPIVDQGWLPLLSLVQICISSIMCDCFINLLFVVGSYL